MTEETDRTDAVWTYVHGEATEVQRAEIEKKLSRDLDLQKTVREINAVDKMLREFVPLTEWSDENLTDCVLRAWEAETNSGAAGGATEAVHAPSKKTFLLRNTAAYWCMAAGIVVGVAVSLMMFTTDPIRWAAPEIVPLQYRGGATLVESADLSRETGMACSSALLDSFRAGYDRRHAGEGRFYLRGSRRNFHMRFKQLPKRAFCIQITAYDRHGRFAREWTEYFADLDAFRSRVDEVGARLLDDLEGLGSVERNVP